MTDVIGNLINESIIVNTASHLFDIVNSEEKDEVDINRDNIENAKSKGESKEENKEDPLVYIIVIKGKPIIDDSDREKLATLS